MKKVYLLKGLDCANCATKIEREVLGLEEVKSSSVNLMKQTLTIYSDGQISKYVTKKIRDIVLLHEPDVEFSENINNSVNTLNSPKENVYKIIFCSFIFDAYFFFKQFGIVYISLLVLSYITLGYDVIFKALKNIIKGRVFDENLLMSISTVGAFVIGEYPEAVAVMLFYQIGEFFQKLAVDRSRRSITELMELYDENVTVIRGDSRISVSLEDVKVGEEILVKPGEKIAFDGILLKGNGMLDTKALTGESVPRSVVEGDKVYSGCINLSDALIIRVDKPHSESTAAKIIEMVENSAAKKASTENFITSFARYYTPLVVIAAVLLAVIPAVFTGEWTEWIHRGFVFLVMSCPCALVISIPLSYFGGIGAASRHGVLVKGSNYLEALTKLSVVAFDKTGTLTKGEFSVVEIKTFNGFDKQTLMSYTVTAETMSDHPLAKSIVSNGLCYVAFNNVTSFKEISGKGVCAVVNKKNVLAGNISLLDEYKIEHSVEDNGETAVYVAIDGVFAGYIVLSDTIKKNAKDCIAFLKSQGVKKTVMLTGDRENLAKRISNEIGTDDFYAELLPNNKVELLESLQAEKPDGTKVAFVGDGINDAPVLARADVGIAMGGLGSDAAIEAADIVLMTDNLKGICDAVKIAKATKRIVIQNIIVALGVKAVFLLMGAFGLAGMWEAVFADVGVAVIAIINAMRCLKINTAG